MSVCVCVICMFTLRKRSLQRLCFHRCLSLRGGSVSVRGVSVWRDSLSGVSLSWGRGLCLGGLCPGGLCLGGLCLGGLCLGGLCLGGSLSERCLSGKLPGVVMCGWCASYWNAFFLFYFPFLASLPKYFWQIDRYLVFGHFHQIFVFSINVYLAY